MSANTELVEAFCQAWSRRNVDEVLAFFTDDGVYHNMPMPPMKGKPAIQAILNQILAPATAVQFDILHMAEAGNVVLNERIDRFQLGGSKVELPVAGVFEIEGGKIKAWRDYFDMPTWTRQTSTP